MLNTLAKAGRLPITGITLSAAVSALETIGIGTDLATFLFNGGLPASQKSGEPKSFDLVDLRKHHVVEHDGSLSRADAWTGDNYSFDAEKWTLYLEQFNGKTEVELKDMAQARHEIIKRSAVRAQAAGFSTKLSLKEETVSFGESALIFAVLKGAEQKLDVAALRSVVGTSIKSRIPPCIYTSPFLNDRLT